MPVLDYYQGKNVLITGTTGFLGKIVLEKMLRTIPGISKIFVLIRKKRGSPTLERFKKEVIGSPCFDRVKKERKDFDEYINKNLIPIEGDLLKEGLDLSPESYKVLTENVHVIINSAASVDFNARLDEAIKINVKGTLRMFELAKNTINLENFVHISTAYVNCEKKSGSWIEEKIYDIDFDAEEKINELEKVTVETILSDTKKLIHPFPNTYTFTKSMTERILKKRKGDIPITIIRPAIIGSSWEEPLPGWVDTISAAGALYFLGSIGLLKFVQGRAENIGDQIPVDFVSDTIIVAAAAYAKSPEINVVHSASSTQNPVSWRRASAIMSKYFKANLPAKRLASPHFRLIPSETELKVKQAARKIPSYLLLQTAKVLNSSTMIRRAEFLQKILKRSEDVAESFKHFTMNEWFYSTERSIELVNFCSPEEVPMFHLDITTLDWDRYLTFFGWGLRKFIMKEDVDSPDEPTNMNILSKRHRKRYFPDLEYALKGGFNFVARDSEEMKNLILSSPRVTEAIAKSAKEGKPKNLSDDQYLRNLEKKAREMCDSMFSTYSMPVMRVMAWSMNKILRSIYDKIVVDETSLEKFRHLNHKEHGPVILMPTHRSYMDFLLVSYVFFNYKLKCPFIAAAEDFLSIKVIHHMLRSSGAFFLRRTAVEPVAIYRAVLYEYIQRLLIDEGWLEFFIEGTRSRIGKMLPPKTGVLTIVTDAYLDKKIPDAQIVPVTINYERVLEGESFPFELLGETKVKESLSRIVKAAKILNKNFGRVYLEFADPISLKSYTKTFVETNKEKQLNPFEDKGARKTMIKELAEDIVNIMQEKVVVTPTSILASVMLMHRKGISEEELIKKVEWVSNELFSRGVKVGTIAESSPTMAFKSAVTHLETLINKKKDIFHPSIEMKTNYKNILMLSYYRNHLLFAFFSEALIVCSLVGFGFETAHKDGVNLDRVLEETLYLQRLLEKEIPKKRVLTKDSFYTTLDLMINRNIITVNNNTIKLVGTSDGLIVQYLCSLVWPFIESYWAVAVFCFSLKSRKTRPNPEVFLQEVQGFAETLYEERMLECFEACSLYGLKNGFDKLIEWQVLKLESVFNETKKKNESLVVLEISEDKLMEVEAHIKRFMRYSYGTSVRSPIDRARKSLSELPNIIGKL